jgi:hypothetical protein
VLRKCEILTSRNLILGYRAAMTRLLAFGFILFVLLGVVGTAQDVTLKKLYDPIEDFQLDHKTSGEFRKSNVSYSDAKRVDTIAGSTLIKYLKRTGRWKSCQSRFPGDSYAGIHAWYVNLGSFTQPQKQQQAYSFTYCEPWAGIGCTPNTSGMVVLEGKNVVALYTDESCSDLNQRFSISDINQNGLSELMLVVPEKPDSEKISIRLLEFPNGEVRNLGDINVGVQANYDEMMPSEFCSGSVDLESTKKTFNSNIIFVLKSKSPLFFSEKYKVNCNYRKIGVQAQKLQNLTPIKPIQRFSRFKRIY